MARPPRYNVDYFPFICSDGKTMFYIEEKYGNDGFATVVKILKELAKTDNHFLDLSKNVTVMFLSAKCKVSKETLICIVNDLVDLEKFDSVLWSENTVIWCQEFVDSIQDAYSKRKNKCITYEGLVILLEGLGVRKQSKRQRIEPVNPQSIVKYSKEENSKVKNTKTEKINLSLVVESFNSICLNSPKVIKTTEKRKKLIKTIFKEFGYEKIGDVFKKVSQSHFLGGGGQTGWVADFDWIMNQNNFIKVLEGKYDKNGSNNNTGSQFIANKQAAHDSANRLFGERQQ